MKNQVIRNEYVIEILWHCNVVEPVIKDVIVTEEYHVLHFMLYQWSLSRFLESLESHLDIYAINMILHNYFL